MTDDQIQCPNCGGYRTNCRKDNFYAETENVIRAGIGKRILYIVPWYFVAALSIGFLGIPYLSKDFRVWMGDFTRLIFKGSFTEKVISRFIAHCKCEICGYIWDWDSITPKPEVTNRPGLITMGEKKLAEEEEERRRRRD